MTQSSIYLHIDHPVDDRCVIQTCFFRKDPGQSGKVTLGRPPSPCKGMKCFNMIGSKSKSILTLPANIHKHVSKVGLRTFYINIIQQAGNKIKK